MSGWDPGWAQVEAVGTVASALILFVAAIVAFFQVRAVRQSDSLNTLLTTVERLQSSEMKFAREALDKLRENRGNQQFVADVAAKRGDPYQQRKLAQPFFSLWEAIGILVKRKLLDKELVMDQYALTILDHWLVLAPYVAATRFQIKDDTAHENFELLASYAIELQGKSMIPKGHPLLCRIASMASEPTSNPAGSSSLLTSTTSEKP